MRTILCALLFMVLFTSCEEKYLLDLDSEHCVNVNIKGRLYVEPTGEKLDNILVEVFFKEKSFFLPQSKEIISGKTDKNGIFNFNTAIDTTSFDDYLLCVMITNPKDYLASYYADKGDLVSICWENYSAEELQNIEISFYKKATLIINFNKTTDDCEYLSVYHSFAKLCYAYWFRIPDFEQDEAWKKLQLETAADIHTKINWEKSMKDGERYTDTDSLICRQNKNNIFNINY